MPSSCPVARFKEWRRHGFSRGAGGRGHDLKAYITTANIVYILVFMPFDFVNIPTT